MKKFKNFQKTEEWLLKKRNSKKVAYLLRKILKKGGKKYEAGILACNTVIEKPSK